MNRPSPRKVSQGEPTRPRPRDPQGRELDEFGLPLSGPARQRRLAELDRPDPNIDPEGWASSGKPKPARKAKPSRKPAPKVAPPAVEAAADAVPDPLASGQSLMENSNG